LELGKPKKEKIEPNDALAPIFPALADVPLSRCVLYKSLLPSDSEEMRQQNTLARPYLTAC
jgi:hypothetical protein